MASERRAGAGDCQRTMSCVPDLRPLRVIAVGRIRALAERNGHGTLGAGEVSGVTPGHHPILANQVELLVDN